LSIAALVTSVRAGFEGLFDQLAGVKATAHVFGKLKLDAGAILAAESITGIIVVEVYHKR